MPYLGEEGTEQFTVEVSVDGETIHKKLIHDPFITSTTFVGMTRWQTFKMLLRPSRIKVQVHVSGSHAAMSRIMMMDPVEMQRENEERERAVASAVRFVGDERAGTIG